MIDFNAELCTYYLDIDLVFLNLRSSFALLAHTLQSDRNLRNLELFVTYLEENYNLIANNRIILLFEKCLQYEKLEFAKILLHHNVGNFNLELLFGLVL
jgi:hypothetical protein